ncbi:MAG: DUF58 domain-containing protein, partial [Thiothrix sp.]
AIHDPLETQLPPQGKLRLTDGRRNLLIQLGQRSWRERYQQRFQQLQKVLHDFSRSYRTPLIMLSTAASEHQRLLQLSRGLR